MIDRRSVAPQVLVAALLTGCGGSGGSGDPGSGVGLVPIPVPVPPGPVAARQWNDLLLDAIRNDFARPTVHARNLFHMSAAMYDAWAVYADTESTYLLGRRIGDFSCELEDFTRPGDVSAAREEAMSFSAYRLIAHRFAGSPGIADTRRSSNLLMEELEFDPEQTSTDYISGSAAALGNHIADCYIRFGLQDGANEENNYAITGYSPVNPGIDPTSPGNPDMVDPDRWQPVALPVFIDQAGNRLEDGVPPFLGPEWGRVEPFALQESDLAIHRRDGVDYYVYHDPGPPPRHRGPESGQYRRGFAMVAVWSSHLDPSDGVMIDISPASTGNVLRYPSGAEEYEAFYDFFEGGDAGLGYASNPVTGAPYTRQLVPRGDYTRVLAEFWADGPDSETPPGHWFGILNEVADHPLLEMRFQGTGPPMDPLEWYVKSYFALGGAMHDAAIAAWGLKGWYDYVRPLSAVRAMADRGQSSDPSDLSYSEDGIPLFPGYIELVRPGDPVGGGDSAHVGKIKIRAWRGTNFVDDPTADTAGVDWILAERWVPYQRPTFVTPPFAGYVSGHSTFSRAAAEVLTELTGSEYFPGGMSEFRISANDFLVFERGPSVDLTLQWATYRDAADQTSLSRIWGGIHPPADDMPGRLIGERVGRDAFARASDYFNGVP